MSVLHVKSITIADGTNSDIVRPSDWLSGHNQFVTLGGNTAGQSTISGTNIAFQGGNNVTLSAATAAGAATIIISGANTSAQTQQPMYYSASGTSTSANTLAFGDTNGVSFSLSNGSVVATVKTDYLTTQSVQTQASGAIAGTGFTSTTTAGTAVVATQGTNGLSMAIPAFITTATQSTQTQASGAIAGTGFTSTTTAGTAVTAALGTNGLSMAVPAFITTYAAQTTQTQATGAIAGTGFTSTTTAGTAVVATQGTNGLSMAVPAFITTYVNDLTSGRAGTGFTSTTTAGTAITAALGTNGLSMAVPAFITTYAAQTTQTQASGNIAGTGYTSTTQAGSTVGVTHNTAGLSMAWPPFITTATQSTQTQASGAIAGTGFTSTTTAGTAITAALGTNGLSMAVPAFVTTYDATSGRAGTGTTLAVTNAAATLSANTNGVALSLNVSHDDFNAWNLVGDNTAGTTSTSISTQGPFYLSGGNNITLSGNSNTIVISAGAGGGTTNQTGPNIAAGGSTITSGTVVFSNSNGVSFGLNGSTMTASVIANNTYDGWAPYADLEMVAGQQGQGTLYFEPEHSPYYFQDRVGVPIAYTNATNSTGSVTLSYWMGFYTQNGSTLSLSNSKSFTTAWTFSGTVASYSLFSGMRLLTFPWSLTVPEGEIYIGHLSRTTTAGGNASISQMLVTQVASNFVGFFGQSHNTTQQWTQGQGVYTATTSAMPNSVAFSQIRGSDSIAFRAPAVMFINSTV